jgi:membrane protease YdiL (CAAX protease family)
MNAISHSAHPQPQSKLGGAGAATLAWSLLMRTVFFLVFGLLFVAIFAWAGEVQPMKAAERWWPYQAILANAATYFVLRMLIRREGGTFRTIFGYERGTMGSMLKQFGWLVVVGFLVGAVPLYAFSYLILGSAVPPDLMFQPLPVWAAVVAVVIFPLTNGLVETPTYIGYAFPRLKSATGSLWAAMLLAGLPLAFQHVALPLVTDVPYMAWRFAAFIPLALALGFIYNRTKKLLPIAMAHYVMDLQLAVTLLAYSL